MVEGEKMKADKELGRKMLANEKRKKLTKVEKELVELIKPTPCPTSGPRICNNLYHRPKRVKRCNYHRTLYLNPDFKTFTYLSYIHSFCDKPTGHKGKHESKIRWG